MAAQLAKLEGKLDRIHVRFHDWSETVTEIPGQACTHDHSYHHDGHDHGHDHSHDHGATLPDGLSDDEIPEIQQALLAALDASRPTSTGLSSDEDVLPAVSSAAKSPKRGHSRPRPRDLHPEQPIYPLFWRPGHRASHWDPARHGAAERRQTPRRDGALLNLHPQLLPLPCRGTPEGQDRQPQLGGRQLLPAHRPQCQGALRVQPHERRGDGPPQLRRSRWRGDQDGRIDNEATLPILARMSWRRRRRVRRDRSERHDGRPHRGHS